MEEKLNTNPKPISWIVSYYLFNIFELKSFAISCKKIFTKHEEIYVYSHGKRENYALAVELAKVGSKASLPYFHQKKKRTNTQTLPK